MIRIDETAFVYCQTELLKKKEGKGYIRYVKLNKIRSKNLKELLAKTALLGFSDSIQAY